VQHRRQPSADLGSHHEAVAAEPGRNVETVVPGHRADDRLTVGRHVVDAVHEQRENDELEARKEVDGGLPDPSSPELRSFGGVAGRAEIAREHATVGELFGGEASVDSDHEGLE
jgi:hypothetical protein